MPDWGVLFKPTAKTVISALAEGPRTLSALAGVTGMSKPALLRHLNDLEEVGLLVKEAVRTTVGREAQYHLNEMTLHVEVRPESGTILSWVSAGRQDGRFPLAAQIVDEGRRRGVASALARVRAGYGTRFRADIAFVLLFGSYARGESTWKSDIDLMFLLRRDAKEVRDKLLDAVADAQDFVDNPIRPHVSTVDAFIAGVGGLDDEVAWDGMVLFGPREVEGVWRKLRRYKSISF